MLTAKKLTEYNARKHDAIAAAQGNASYDARHIEIFNPTEQKRLACTLRMAAGWRVTPNAKALDYGCGTGNLTAKLIEIGFEVCAADVSQGMCDLVRSRFSPTIGEAKLSTVKLSGEFPLPFPDKHFGFVSTYSVLHHVPDYELAVSELVRVLDTGGVLYIDHEISDEFWRAPFGVRLYRFLLRPYWGIPRLARKLSGRAHPGISYEASSRAELPEEGDIHIFPDDHIEWDKIRGIARRGGLQEIPTGDYLSCGELARFPLRHWICKFLAADTGIYVGVKSAVTAL